MLGGWAKWDRYSEDSEGCKLHYSSCGTRKHSVGSSLSSIFYMVHNQVQILAWFWSIYFYIKESNIYSSDQRLLVGRKPIYYLNLDCVLTLVHGLIPNMLKYDFALLTHWLWLAAFVNVIDESYTWLTSVYSVFIFS